MTRFEKTPRKLSLLSVNSRGRLAYSNEKKTKITGVEELMGDIIFKVKKVRKASKKV